MRPASCISYLLWNAGKPLLYLFSFCFMLKFLYASQRWQNWPFVQQILKTSCILCPLNQSRFYGVLEAVKPICSTSFKMNELVSITVCLTTMRNNSSINQFQITNQWRKSREVYFSFWLTTDFIHYVPIIHCTHYVKLFQQQFTNTTSIFIYITAPNILTFKKHPCFCCTATYFTMRQSW